MILVSSFQLHHFCDSEMKAGKPDLCSVSLLSQRMAVPHISLRKKTKKPYQTFEEFSCICAMISFFYSLLEKPAQVLDCFPLSVHQQLAKKSWLRPPGS